MFVKKSDSWEQSGASKHRTTQSAARKQDLSLVTSVGIRLGTERTPPCTVQTENLAQMEAATLQSGERWRGLKGETLHSLHLLLGQACSQFPSPDRQTVVWG